MNKALFLDFDGVLFNTIKEVYLVNRCLFKGADVFEPVDKEEYDLYSKYKYLVYNIWMFTYYNPLIFSNTKEEYIEEKFKEALGARDRKQEEEFYTNFINIRYNLIKNNYDFWKNLEEPYEFFFYIKELHRNNDIKIIIVSKKNKSSIIERFTSYDFNLDEKYIFAEEYLSNYLSKGEFIEEYISQNSIDKAIFVDDNLNNLLTLSNNKVKNILALWGNTPPNSKGYKQEEAIEQINYLISI